MFSTMISRSKLMTWESPSLIQLVQAAGDVFADVFLCLDLAVYALEGFVGRYFAV